MILNSKVPQESSKMVSSNTHTHKVSKKDRDEFTPGCLKGEVLSRVFAEDYQLIETSILDPRGPVVRHWNELLNVVIFRDGTYLTLKEVFESMDLTGSRTRDVEVTEPPIHRPEPPPARNF